MLSGETSGQTGEARRRKIVLIGYMGCGKSRVGVLVGEMLGVGFVDTDTLVEQRAGCSVSNVFEQHGEEHFRTLETQAIARAIEGPWGVIALGGGAATREQNWDLLRRNDVASVYLRATPEVILARVKDHTHRPLLAGLTPEQMLEKITAMLADRGPWYERAEFVLDTDNATTRHDTASRLIDMVSANAQATP